MGFAEGDMNLVDDWKYVLKRAWSIRLMLLAGLFSGLEIALPILDGILPIPRGVFAALSGTTTAAAFVARLLAQKRTGED
jgi:hypothetical protein